MKNVYSIVSTLRREKGGELLMVVGKDLFHGSSSIERMTRYKLHCQIIWRGVEINNGGGAAQKERKKEQLVIVRATLGPV